MHAGRRLNNSHEICCRLFRRLSSGAGEKIICLRNAPRSGLINGHVPERSSAVRPTSHIMPRCISRRDPRPKTALQIAGEQDFLAREYENETTSVFDPKPQYRHNGQPRSVVSIDSLFWGYAITCHRGAGKPVTPTVVVVDDGLVTARGAQPVLLQSGHHPGPSAPPNPRLKRHLTCTATCWSDFNDAIPSAATADRYRSSDVIWQRLREKLPRIGGPRRFQMANGVR